MDLSVSQCHLSFIKFLLLSPWDWQDQIRHLVGLKTTWLERANAAESNLVVTYEEARSIQVKKR